MDFTTFFNAFKDNPGATVAVAEMFALIYFVRDGRAREREHLQTVLTIAPLAQKLADTVVVAERLMSKAAGTKE